ncbi:MAG: dephospho-CoA kinase [Deltaproteobacteria bacterium]|nr:dephospho-CoA kinase [Deltaproteobacteria bacterium]
MRIVGITGGIASGKSLVAGWMRDTWGVPVLDADLVARQVVAPGSPVLEAVVAAFGPSVLGLDGDLDRAALGARVSRDPAARRRLEALTHPAIWAEIEAWLRERAAEGHALAAVEAALIVETGQAGRFDALVVVTAPRALRVQRLVERRGLTEAQARAWVDSQAPEDEKVRLGDVVLANDGSPADLRVALAAAWRRIRGDGVQ